MKGIGNVAPEGIVAIRPENHFGAIDIYPGFAHRPIEDDDGAASGTGLDTGVDHSAIPSGADIGQTSRPSGLQCGTGLQILGHEHVLEVVLPIERTVNRPIVGHGHAFP